MLRVPQTKDTGKELILLQDMRNHGDSPHDPRHDYVAMAQDVEEFIDEQGLKEPTLIGHSMFVLQCLQR